MPYPKIIFKNELFAILRFVLKKKAFLYIIIGTFFIYVLARLVWLSGLFFIVTLLFTITWSQLKKLRNGFLRTSLKTLFSLFSVMAISAVLKIFVFDIYVIPSNSMEDTLLPGDVILVNKLEYGPSLPRNPFEISWLNLFFYLIENESIDIEKNWWAYKRLPGLRTIKKGDIIVYQPRRAYYEIKRCVAIAGDTLSIINGEIFIGDSILGLPKSIKNEYNVLIDNEYKFFREAHERALEFALYPNTEDRGSLYGFLSQCDIEELSSFSTVKGVNKLLDVFKPESKIFANPEGTYWSLDNMGPIVIPLVDAKIECNEYNFEVYKKLIPKSLGTKENNVRTKEYSKSTRDCFAFKKDYFFLMGDNRKNSVDSRYIGFISMNNIVGRAQVVLFSRYDGTTRWGRFFKFLK